MAYADDLTEDEEDFLYKLENNLSEHGLRTSKR